GEAAHLRGLIRQHIHEAQTDEWPAMASHRATITIVPASLAQAMKNTLALPVQGEGQAAAQRSIVASLQDALEHRRQPMLISQSGVNPVKWMSLILPTPVCRAERGAADRAPASAARRLGKHWTVDRLAHHNTARIETPALLPPTSKRQKPERTSAIE